MANEPAMRVAFVSGGLGFGGATTLLLELAGELAARGMATLVFTLTQNTCGPKNKAVPASP